MSEQLSINPNPQEEAVATDPSVLGGNTVQASDEEVYEQKIKILEDILQKQTDASLSAQRKAFVSAVGGDREAEKVNFWEAIKKQEAALSHTQVIDILTSDKSAWSKPEEEKDLIDKIITSVALDMRGNIDPDQAPAGEDIVDFNVGGELRNLVDTDELQNPNVLTRATHAIHLLVADGLYKLHQWGDASQLKTALELVETYAEHVRGFNPKEAGFDEAKESLTMALAALQTDQSSKPNYRYAKPERNHLFSQTSNGLKQLRRTEAHIFLRFQDFDLPTAG